MSDSPAPWTAAHQAPLSFTISQSLLKFMSIESMMLSNHLSLCQPLLLLPSVFSSIRVFSNDLVIFFMDMLIDFFEPSCFHLQNGNYDNCSSRLKDYFKHYFEHTHTHIYSYVCVYVCDIIIKSELSDS